MAFQSETVEIEMELEDERMVTITLHSEDDGFDHEFGYQQEIGWYIDEIIDENGGTIDEDDLSSGDQERASERASEQSGW